MTNSEYVVFSFGIYEYPSISIAKILYDTEQKQWGFEKVCSFQQSQFLIDMLVLNNQYLILISNYLSFELDFSIYTISYLIQNNCNDQTVASSEKNFTYDQFKHAIYIAN